jgi:hypothetical protein
VPCSASRVVPGAHRVVGPGTHRGSGPREVHTTTPKLVASSGVAQGDSKGNGASLFFGTHTSKPKFHCTFCNKDGHIVEFCFRRVKHKPRVRAKAFKKPRSLSHGTCDSNVGSKSSIEVDASCSKSQGTSHLQEKGDLSTQTVPPDRPLYLPLGEENATCQCF